MQHSIIDRETKGEPAMRLISLAIITGTLVLGGCSDSGSNDPVGNASEGTGSNAEQTDSGNQGSTDQNSTDSGNTSTDSGSGSTDAGTEMVDNTEGNAGSADTSATYNITFNSTWSAQTHAVGFPGGAHFSGLVGAVHNDQVTFWEPGQIATDGIELMAETGSKSIFLDEVNAAIASGYAAEAIDGPGLATTPGAASVTVTVTVDNPKITLTTMLAPSPDWFTGFHDVRLYDEAGFVDTLSIDAIVYDSGTDSGDGFTSANSDTNPPDVIVRTTTDPQNSPFVEGLPNVGQFVITRQ